MAAIKGKLTEQVRTFIVQSLAMFDAPSVVVDAVKAEFGIIVSRQSVENYDPHKRAGKNLSEKWKTVFEATRDEFIKNTSRIGVSHRSVRIRALQRMAAKAEEMRNISLAAQLLEQAAKEMGNAYTNRREITGANGGAVAMITTAMSAREAADAYASTLNDE